METKSEILTMPLMHVYHLTHDGMNTGYTLEEVTEMITEHGSDHKIEITVTIPIQEIIEETTVPTEE
jgi:hypothetical protein